MKKTIRVLTLGSALLSPMAHADILGVSDAALLVKAIEQLEQLRSQYQLLSQTYNNAKSQLDGIENLTHFNSGHYGFGSLSNSASDLKNRQWSPNTWDDALNNIAGGNPTRYQELVNAYQKNHPAVNETAYLKGASPSRLKQYQSNQAVNQAIGVQATYAFNEVNQHLQAIHDLSARIDQADNTKAAVDLNSRLLAELAYIQMENLRLQTLISQQTAATGAGELTVDGESALFNTLPDE
ncbi:type IV secretion system protein [Legionella spiritensis]|uniref:Vir protein B5 n=1 Tax=Legionella spiritensis TaxID=452 RepID=A0A0W0Z8B6_LEGSP|nr:type IV secretion system protein [Legionella spiritensis]KTD65362.1 vir protein B5 [Legionella spiritensis]SNV47274.1 protein LvhB5 [Legionella spiritensis]